MLSFNQRAVEKEETIARRALELFLTVHGLTWADSYPLAAYERTAPPVVFQDVLKGIGRGKSFDHASNERVSADPISELASDYAWQRRT